MINLFCVQMLYIICLQLLIVDMDKEFNINIYVMHKIPIMLYILCAHTLKRCTILINGYFMFNHIRRCHQLTVLDSWMVELTWHTHCTLAGKCTYVTIVSATSTAYIISSLLVFAYYF